MSYGLKVQSFDAGGNAITQIDTTQSYVQYVVTHMGTGSAISASGISPRAKILVKPNTDANGNYEEVVTYTGGMSGNYELCILAGTWNGPTIKFVVSDPMAYYRDGFAWYEAYNPVSCSYIIIQDVTDVTPVGDYGLQTLTAGGASAFDSRKIKFNNSIRVGSIIPARSLGGGAASTDVISNDSSNYIDARWTYWDTLGSNAGIHVRVGTQQTRYFDQDRDEPDPTQGFNPTYYYDNYSVIWLVNLI